MRIELYTCPFVNDGYHFLIIVTSCAKQINNIYKGLIESELTDGLAIVIMYKLKYYFKDYWPTYEIVNGYKATCKRMYH